MLIPVPIPQSAGRAGTVRVAMTSGRLITIEGIDGAGKTTLAAALEERLRAHGLRVQLLREPGGVRAAERVRELVTDPALEIGPRAEALLYAAARAQLVEEAIRPLLDDGAWVLLDRFVDSSLAYQGAGRELGLDAVRAINQFATGGVTPDRTLLLALDSPVARARSRSRAQPADRLEREEQAFFDRIAEGYLELARAEPQRIRQIDANGQPGEVLEAAWAGLADLLPSSPRSSGGGEPGG
ncbi:MAG: dTMP kinase [Solirubrobacteraceae bacterium]